jgi:Cdc6-like AAA superfamily ATPase
LTAERYPLPLGTCYYEGRGLISEKNIKLVGRESEYNNLNKALSGMIRDEKNDSAIAISGMGGIGYFFYLAQWIK